MLLGTCLDVVGAGMMQQATCAIKYMIVFLSIKSTYGNGNGVTSYRPLMHISRLQALRIICKGHESL